MPEAELSTSTLHPRDAHEMLRRVQPDADGGCLSACCALAIELLFGLEACEVQSILVRAFAEMEGGATFANANILLARLFSVRSHVVSGSLEEMCRLNGAAGQVILGVDPSLAYAGAVPGRHAVPLASCIASHLPAWAAGFLDPVPSGTPDPVRFLDPARPASPEREMSFSALATAFDRAGREALLVEHGRARGRRRLRAGGEH